MAERIIELRAEVERLQAILGELYVQRGEDVSTLRDAIRRAFRDSTQEASATGLRDSLPAGPWRDTLTIAIEQHYQHRPLSTDWKAGDPCHSCGSVDTHLEGSEAWCDGCGADERADSADA